jgi:hypothetical protein
MEVSSARVILDTRKVTVSPWRQRKIGAGNEWFTVRAIRGAPVKFTDVSSIRKSKLVPESVEVGSRKGGFCADSALVDLPRLTAALPNASPLTKVRRDIGGPDVNRFDL